MKIGARNQIQGKVKAIEAGAVNSEVVIELPGGQQVVSVITKSSVERLSLAVGQTVTAIIKASDVIIAVD